MNGIFLSYFSARELTNTAKFRLVENTRKENLYILCINTIVVECSRNFH